MYTLKRIYQLITKDGCGAFRSLNMKRVISLLLTFILAFSLVGCSGSSGESFTYYLGGGLRSLDPQTATGNASAQVLSSIFEGLCYLDSDHKAASGVAESWESNEDFTEYTFNLRNDALWSDGTNITAFDFVFAFRRAVDPDTKASNADDMFILKNARQIYQGLAETESLGVSAESDYVLKVQLESSDPDFPELTANPKYYPCNEAFFNSTSGRYGLGVQYLLTNGPFRFSGTYSWTDGVSIALSHFSDYAGDRPSKPSELVYTMTEDEAAAADPVTALENNDADILKLSKSQAGELADKGGTVFTFNNAVSGLVFNSSDENMSNPELRELFVKTINRESLFSELPEEITEASDIIPDSILLGAANYRETAGGDLYVKQDNSVAEDVSNILGELGSSVLPAVTVICRDDDLSVALVNKILVSWNTNIGSYFNIMPLTDDEFESRIYSKDYQVALYTVESGGDTPYSFLNAFESTASPSLLSSDAFDTLLHEANKTADDYIGLEKFLNNQYIFYPIYKEQTYYGLALGVKGVSMRVGLVDFTNAVK